MYSRRMINSSAGRKPALPDGGFHPKTMRESTFDQPHRTFNGDLQRRDQEMDMIPHDNKRVKFVPAFSPIVL